MDGEDPVGILGRTLDEMADSIEAEREFERRLTADVAHELRTPLQAIQATVEAMQDGVLPADEEHLQTVRDETVRLARLADSILELARLESRAVPVPHERDRSGVAARARRGHAPRAARVAGAHTRDGDRGGYVRLRRHATGSRRRSATC